MQVLSTGVKRTGSELTESERLDIINTMLGAGVSKDEVRKYLSVTYHVTERTITSLLARETMQRQREAHGIANSTTEIQGNIQKKVYRITHLKELNDTLREKIYREFSSIWNEHFLDPTYDFRMDLEAISDNYQVEPNILEIFVKNRFPNLGGILERLKVRDTSQTLTEQDKTQIREYVNNGIDEEEKKSRRREMSLKYRVSINVISGVTAWKTNPSGALQLLKSREVNNGDNVVLLPVALGERGRVVNKVLPGIPTGLMPQSVPELEAYVIDNETEEVKAVELNSDFVQELAKEFDHEDEECRTEFVEYVFGCYPEATLKDIQFIIPDFPHDVSHQDSTGPKEGIGALVNYNNKIKNKWRRKLKDFIDENTDPTKRKNMKVLCLPGVECLEVPLYLELGFEPSNILGVEAGIVKGRRDSVLIKRFEANASRYGIQIRVGDLAKILETEETVFDIVSLDFLGPLGNGVIEILRKVKTNKQVGILLNFLGKRESIFSSTLMKKLDHLNMRVDAREAVVSNDGNYTEQLQAFMSNSMEELKVFEQIGCPGASLQSGRDQFGLYLIFNNINNNSEQLLPAKLHPLFIALKRTYPRYSYTYNEGFDFNTFFIHHIGPFFDQLLKKYSMVRSNSGLSAEGIILYLWEIFENAYAPVNSHIIQFKKPIMARKYTYNSRVGKISSPFYSDFTYFRLLDHEYEEFCKKYRYPIEFLRVIVTDFVTECVGEIYICDKNGLKKKEGDAIQKSDKLGYRGSGYAEVQLGTFLGTNSEGLNTFSSVMKILNEDKGAERIQLNEDE